MDFMPNTLNDNRINLRVATIDDAQIVYDYAVRNKTHIEEFGDEAFPSLDRVNTFLANIQTSAKQKCYLIYTDNTFIGVLNIWDYSKFDRGCKLGYSLDGHHVGHGYMQSAIKLAIGELFKNGLVRIEVQTSLENMRSINMIKKCGFELEGVLRKSWLIESAGKYSDVYVYSIINTENAEKIEADFNKSK